MEYIGTRRNFVFYCKSPEKIEHCEKACIEGKTNPHPCTDCFMMQHWE